MSTSPEGDELLEMIREIVKHHGVPPQHRSIVIDAVVHVAVTVMSQPRFYANLKPFIALTEQNQILRQQLANLSAVVYRSNMNPKPPPKKRPAKKTAPIKPAGIRVKGSSAQAFKRGAQGR